MKNKKFSTFLTVLFSIISVFYMYPIALVVMNSFKKKAYISKKPFALPNAKSFVGFDNYISGIQKTGLIQAAWVSLFVTVLSVIVIVLCTSMCAWYITRVHTKFTAAVYYLCL
ncbi:MAG TPA: carbohydrate ABC transporter permease, partial [Oribacterium sp.]|nr:carbohydrate ABC transporter permease [Oribacterium sp.]